MPTAEKEIAVNICKYALIDSTLREGEQFVHAHFTTAEKVKIARLLDDFGVEYIEATSPIASPRSAADLRALTRLGLRAKVLTHVRCAMADARAAVASGVAGVNLLFATSPRLRQVSHGRGLDEIIAEATGVIAYIQGAGLEVRFSSEDAFRTDPDDLLRIYRAVDALGVDRVGLADTVGIATPRQVFDVVSRVRAAVRAGIEFHAHNDSGCAIANAFCALEAGATHIDVTVLGIGERNGITHLGGLIARLASLSPDLVSRYRLCLLNELDSSIADLVGVPIPFNNYITGATAFTHKAGMHIKAMLADPRSYEVLRPEAFGRTRTIVLASRLTGRHAIAYRARELGMRVSDATIREVTSSLKALADRREVGLADVDHLLHEAANPAAPVPRAIAA
jgi:homocitrate synthase